MIENRIVARARDDRHVATTAIDVVVTFAARDRYVVASGVIDVIVAGVAVNRGVVRVVMEVIFNPGADDVCFNSEINRLTLRVDNIYVFVPGGVPHSDCILPDGQIII